MYYIYIYLDPRINGVWGYNELTFSNQPFYVGKGKGRRLKEHLFNSSLKRNNAKNQKIKVILKENLTPIIIKIYVDLTEEEAFIKEKEIITHFGRVDNKTGILCNHTDGGEGQSGLLHSQAAKEKISKANSGPNGYWYGKKIKEENKRHLWGPKSDKVKANISKGLLGNQNCVGRKLSKESIEKGRQKQNLKEYSFYSPEGIIHTGKGLSSFAQKHNLKQGHLSELLSGKRKNVKGWTLA